VTYTLHRYTHQPDTSAYGLEAARKLGLDPGRVFKTLIVETADGTLAVAIVPVTGRLGLKACAQALATKRVRLAGSTAAERATGYVLGGISPLGQKRHLEAVLDESASEHETIFVSAGRRGLEIELRPADLARLTRASFALLTAP